MTQITIERSDLQQMLEMAAEKGAALAIDALACYHYKDACRLLGVSYNTLQRRITEGKIRPVDGRITGAEIRRYLSSQHSGNR